MANGVARAGVHNCRYPRKGSSTCTIHQFAVTAVQTLFVKTMIENFSVDERRRLHECSSQAMLPPDGRIPLDAMPAEVITRELDLALALMRYRESR